MARRVRAKARTKRSAVRTSGAWRSFEERGVDRRQDVMVEGDGYGGRHGYRQNGKERWDHRCACAATCTGRTLSGVMVRRWVMIILHDGRSMRVMCDGIGRVAVLGHRLMIVIVLCCSRGLRTEGHRCGSEALDRHRQQDHPNDHDFQDGFHAAILAYATVSADPPIRSI
jgi:hypothetical protein